MSTEAQSAEIAFDRSFVAAPGALVALTPHVRRLLADNPGPMTFTGTCTYVVGQGEVAIIDPGPDLPQHVGALLAALRHETVSHILVTHTHRDHSGAAAALKAATGAKIIGCAAARLAPAPSGDDNGPDSAHDFSYAPDTVMCDGDVLAARDFTLQAIATPGHTGNHLSFALAAENALFSGDHVMAWSSSVIIPPDGAMADYMASLEKLQRRNDAVYWPGHGGPVRAPQPYLAALIRHRRQREAAVLAALGRGAMTATALVAAIYQDIDPSLKAAARLSVRAHLEDLVARGHVRIDARQDADRNREAFYRLS